MTWHEHRLHYQNETPDIRAALFLSDYLLELAHQGRLPDVALFSDEDIRREVERDMGTILSDLEKAKKK